MVEEGGIGTGRRGVGRETEMRSSSENEPSFRHGDEVPETTSGTERGTGGNTEEVTKARGRGREVLRTEILEIQMRERKIHRAGV